MLENISPVDGRYQAVTAPLREFFSESALIRYRIFTEIRYFVALAEIPLPQLESITEKELGVAENIGNQVDREDILRVKEIESRTNHDIKAVEYFIKERFEAEGIGRYKEYVHFGLTSQDINNTAFPLMLRDASEKVIFPALDELLSVLGQMSNTWLKLPMLARTHGQPASPTTLGKEIMVFYDRIAKQYETLRSIPYPAKFGGATGNFNAHYVSFPNIDWVGFADRFTASLGLERSRITTQIDHYDGLAEIFDACRRICTIITDLDRDIWTYISIDYFKQKIVEGEVGSSAMPHKVNPIDFENAEGNAGIASACFSHLSAKLPISRLQRDLTDSTVLRNIGVPLAHFLISIRATLKGLKKLGVNQEKIYADLEEHSVVISEAIQSILRTINYPSPYEALKGLTRKNKTIGLKDIHDFIEGLDIDEKQKERLREITPFNYTGIIPKPVE